ncbi:MAG TPA: isoprenylcysteine carboxylmethyltransferase family protein [Blastocatellia bacterium]|nr:isoprenylcysteine carboxylmethyltransferase family protein [Blastocatellia bacterium]
MVEATRNHRLRLLHLAQRIRVPAGLVLAPLLIISAKPSPRTLLIGAAVAFAGLWIRAWASGYLRKNMELTTSGPYAYTRNPLYLGTFIMGGGIALASGAWWFAVVYVTLYLLIYVPVMIAEAETLEQLFADEYPDYSREVPLFVPRATAYQSPRTGGVDRERRFSWSQYSRHREYRAAIGVVVALALLVAKTFIFTR